ncbi:MAG TPA: glycosyltransferase family 9 protein [Pseudomonadales bacterium]|nr:glycosyltransferase family 9 protein [Pseudomonadales bacterium]
MDSAPKILAIQFKYFGDAVLMTPALRAIHEHYPQGELHLLVPEEIAPIFQHEPWLTRVWPMPRKRGTASPGRTWPIISQLRKERFDKSVDFASNDRGAITSFLVGAKERLGRYEESGFWGRKFCYTKRVPRDETFPHESAHLAQLLSGWEIPMPRNLEAEIHADPVLAGAAKEILPGENTVICHVASSQPKKEWPLGHWAKLHRLASDAGRHLAFTTARGERELSLMTEFKKLAPEAVILPLITELPLFLAVLQRAAVFVSGDTGPLHFAAGLGVPTISLFGPSSPARWAPIGERHQALVGIACSCDGNSAVCQRNDHCLAAISPEQVLALLTSHLQ